MNTSPFLPVSDMEANSIMKEFSRKRLLRRILHITRAFEETVDTDRTIFSTAAATEALNTAEVR